MYIRFDKSNSCIYTFGCLSVFIIRKRNLCFFCVLNIRSIIIISNRECVFFLCHYLRSVGRFGCGLQNVCLTRNTNNIYTVLTIVPANIQVKWFRSNQRHVSLIISMSAITHHHHHIFQTQIDN